MSAVSDLDCAQKVASHGHSFVKKTFHRPTYCHQCTDLLWGIIQQGSVCEVCNFVVHDRCIRTVAYPCISVAITHIQNPVPHCWSEQGHYKRKFCNVCRKRLDESMSLRCEICEYYIHVDCQDFAIPNCMECATFIPERVLEHSTHHHHWREGNLPTNSKCSVCKKSCWSAECLAGLRCEWCGMTVHGGCLKAVPQECIFGVLEPIVLPPASVSIPRTEVPMEAVLGVTRRKEAISRACSRAICEDMSSCDLKGKDDDSSSGGVPASKESKSGKKNDEKEREERDEEIIKVFDGNWSLRRRTFRLITVSKTATLDTILAAALKAFHIRRDPLHFYLTDAYAAEEKELTDLSQPLTSLLRREGKRPAIFLRLRDEEEGELEIFPSHLHGVASPRIVKVDNDTTVDKIIKTALPLFGLPNETADKFQLTEMTLDKGVLERVMSLDEQPWELLKSTSRDSLRQMELTRFYLQRKEDPHGPTIALYVGNLPVNLSQRQYEQILLDILGLDNKYSSIGPIYYEYGALVITYTNCEEAVRAFYTCRDAFVEEKNLIVLLLPNVTPEMVPKKDRPLLVFVNVKSGGCQGLELISSFRKLLNPYQVYDLTNGGPLPGLYVFRKIPNYRILVCGGDGTIGWVLQCLDNVGQDSVCSRPPCAIVPLGTGNDLARVLHWGAGYTGAEDPMSLLKDVIDAEEIRLDRWTVVVHCDETAEPKPIMTQLPACAQIGSTQQQDNTQIYVMNNYCGIGIDADLCLGFHNAREENPNKFNSRWTNKGVYVKLGMQKLISRKMCKLCKDLHKHIVLEVDGKRVEMPPIEGIIILNILSWGSGANPWGPEKDDHFTKPNHWDGILEVVGVTGPFHLGQIQSGLRSAIRIAQGGHIRIRVNSDVPVHVDGEPWIQSACEITILRSALKATMLKKNKMKRRNTEPAISQAEESSG